MLPRKVAVLPFLTDVDEHDLTRDLNECLLKGIYRHQSPIEYVIDEKVRRLNRGSLIDIMRSTSKMKLFAESRAVEHIIAGIAKRFPGGDLLIFLVLFNAEENRITACEWGIYDDDIDACIDTEQLGYRLTRFRNYASVDAAILQSIIIPGSGQSILGEPVHAVFSIGCVIITALFEPQLLIPAWILNVLDTMAIWFIQKKEVDTRLFFWIVESFSG